MNAYTNTVAAALALSAPAQYPVYGDRPVYRPRLHATKPFVTTAEMRKRKKLERQRKRDARRKSR